MFLIDRPNGTYRFSISCGHGGYNYFDSNDSPYGYRLYVERFVRDGNTSKVLTNDTENMMIFLKEAKRCSKKKIYKYCDLLDIHREELVKLYFSDRDKFKEMILEIFKEV